MSDGLGFLTAVYRDGRVHIGGKSYPAGTFAVQLLNQYYKDAVQLPHPLHRIGCFQLLGHTFALCHLLYKTLEHFLSLSVDVNKVAVQLAAGQQIAIEYTMMFLEIPKMALTPYPNICLFFFRQSQTR